jgi:hypothetical protein
MKRVAEFRPESGSTGVIGIKQGFAGGWTFTYSADGRSRNAVPLEWSAVAAYDAAGQLSWRTERALLSMSAHERLVPPLALTLAKEAGLERSVPHAWAIDPASTTMLQLAYFAIFFVAGGLPVLAVVMGVVHLLTRGAQGALVRLNGTGGYRVPDAWVTALERRRTAALVSGIFDIVLGVVLGVVLYGGLILLYTRAGGGV